MASNTSCRNCGHSPANRARSLCWRCSMNPAIRAEHETLSPYGRRSRVPDARRIAYEMRQRGIKLALIALRLGVSEEAARQLAEREQEARAKVQHG